MCGFANFASLGIMIAGLRSIAPEKEKEILSLGPKSILAGVIATLMTGAVAGILL
jgi:CNT family concentrative nucleoside transporter